RCIGRSRPGFEAGGRRLRPDARPEPEPELERPLGRVRARKRDAGARLPGGDGSGVQGRGPPDADWAACPRRRGGTGEARGRGRRVPARDDRLRCLPPCELLGSRRQSASVTPPLRAVRRRLDAVMRIERVDFADPAREVRPVSRPELLERYRALPFPTTTDEPWRFTDLKGFDPDAFV